MSVVRCCGLDVHRSSINTMLPMSTARFYLSRENSINGSFMTTFNKRLEAHLSKCGLDLDDLKQLPRLRAAYKGKSFHATFTNWKKKRDISKEAQLLIAADLEISPGWAVDGRGTPPNPTRTKAILSAYRAGAIPKPAEERKLSSSSFGDRHEVDDGPALDLVLDLEPDEVDLVLAYRELQLKRRQSQTDADAASNVSNINATHTGLSIGGQLAARDRADRPSNVVGARMLGQGSQDIPKKSEEPKHGSSDTHN